MIDLYKVCLNPYDDKEISTDELVSYTQAHLALVIPDPIAANLSADLTAVDSALDGLDVKVTDEETKLGLQKARVHAKRQFRADLFNDIARIYGAALAAFGPNAPEIDELFPSGRDIFTTSADSHLANHLASLAAAVTTHVATLGAPMQTLANSLVSSWGTIYSAVNTAKGAKGGVAIARRAAGAALRTALGLLHLGIGRELFGEPEHAASLFPQYLLGQPVEDDPSGGGSGDDGDGGGEVVPTAPTLSSTIDSGVVTLAMTVEGSTTFNVYQKGPADPDFVLVASAVETGWASGSLPSSSGEWAWKVAGIFAGAEGPLSAITTQGL